MNIQDIYKYFTLLREIFAGFSKRHDCYRNRVVIYEDYFHEFSWGPNDDFKRKSTSRKSFIIKEPEKILISEQDKITIKQQRPESKFISKNEHIYYRKPSILGGFMGIGDYSIFNYFSSYALDAGYLLHLLLTQRNLSINVPELLPINYFSEQYPRDTETGKPKQLLEKWLLFIHILAWQKKDSPLTAKRCLWINECTFFGDPEKIYKMHSDYGFIPPEFEKIPFPPRYFASTLQHDINLASVYAIDLLLNKTFEAPDIQTTHFKNELANIKSGQNGATAYHKLVVKILDSVFNPELQNPETEVNIDNGRGRIDIVYDNKAEAGYFYNLVFRHNFKCPYVFFECKNYSSQINNTEFNQLHSRFSKKRGNVGFIVCRKVRNKEKLYRRCQDFYKNNEVHLLVLDDDDLLYMLEQREKNKIDKLEEYLNQILKKIIL